MATSATRPPTSEARHQRPLGIRTMRASARRLLAEDAELPSTDEVETLTLRLRGHIMVAVPEVEQMVGTLPRDDTRRACARACIGEARMRMRLEPGATLPARIAHAQRLARSVNALCDHYENLGES
ncbi:DUF6415 family natural product biosynthesis protein [Streptomyces violaceusniger]|uniref:Uncharacterized protein n=1 Tax=Streptomyces violaceusniger (strain Tu 4113) TaxID=653045 RepID=G2P141_STRV4|nr:DUF6415 family natural product biosynthesis protein [Streptomyces violaceusniger]AEM87880.1 hypothetical protein Strvi_8572 [Streptomyces violaceusniger Tu 4113]